MMQLHHLPQDCTSSGRGVETKLSKPQRIDAIKVKNVQRHDSCAKPINPEEEILGTYGLESIRGSPAEPSEVDLEFDTWLGVLNLTSWETKY